ncbi:MAG: type II toxin-antitoxin system mRNA interferase toxin, RelE/StbE family [Nanoarchaeota archaeon]
MEIKEEADKIFSKLAKKNPKLLTVLNNKIKEILKNPFGYKPLRKPLTGFRRVHIEKHFVLIFHVDHSRKVC